MLGIAYHRNGLVQEAVSELRKAVNISDGDPSIEAYRGIVLALSGEEKAAETVLHELVEVSKKTYVSDVFLGYLLFALGKHDEAFEKLELAFQRRSTDFSQFEMYAWKDFQELYKDPRWAGLKKGMGLP